MSVTDPIGDMLAFECGYGWPHFSGTELKVKVSIKILKEEALSTAMKLDGKLPLKSANVA
jgi:hypothetical protein